MVHVRSFLLSSSFDLKKLKPKFRDVILAQGNDYLVLGFRPSNGITQGCGDAADSNQTIASNFPEGPAAMAMQPGALFLLLTFAQAQCRRAGRAGQPRKLCSIMSAQSVRRFCTDELIHVMRVPSACCCDLQWHRVKGSERVQP